MQAPNKRFDRYEVRIELMNLRNEAARMAMVHRDAFRKDLTHDESTCKICLKNEGELRAFEHAYRHFGGRL